MKKTEADCAASRYMVTGMTLAGFVARQPEAEHPVYWGSRLVQHKCTPSGMFPDNDGSWVHIEDVRRLRAERDKALIEKCDRLRTALLYAKTGFSLAYDAASKHLNDEVILHCGHHEARVAAALTEDERETHPA